MNIVSLKFRNCNMLNYNGLKSRECFCGLVFLNSYKKPNHSKTCSIYQRFKNEYLTEEKVNDLLNIQRHNKNWLFNQPIYDTFCLSDYNEIFRKVKCERFFTLKDGSRMSLSQIDEFLNYDFLHQKYIVEQKDVPDIIKELNNKFTNSTIFDRLTKCGIPIRNAHEAMLKNVDKVSQSVYRKYGVSNISKLQEIKQKKVQTALRNYGVEHHFKNKQKLEELEENIEFKYGNGIRNVSQLNEIKKLKEKTFFKNYGIRNIFCNSDYIRDCYLKKLGVDNPSKLNWVQHKKYETFIKNLDENVNVVPYSKMSVKLFDSISKKFPQIASEFLYATHNAEKYILTDDSFYCLDFCVERYKIVIEFNGDIWHANPAKYKIDDKPNFQTPNKTAGDIWNHDKKKIDCLETMGYHVLIVWESDYVSNKDQILNQCCDFINHYMEEK